MKKKKLQRNIFGVKRQDLLIEIKLKNQIQRNDCDFWGIHVSQPFFLIQNIKN